MSPRQLLCRFLLPVAVVIGFATTPAVRADLPPHPRPQPSPPPPEPTPPPKPIPDDPDEVRTAVVAGSAALGVTLLGVWVAHRSRRILIQRPTVPAPS